MTYTVVIGTTFVDIKGFSENAYDPQGRNLGTVKTVHGGVGRNVAENFANAGMPVSFVGTLEDSAFGNDVRRRLSEKNVSLEHAINAEQGIGMWLVILDENGNLAGSISRMPDTAPLEAYLLSHGDAIISAAENIVLEIDLNERIASTVFSLAKKYGKPVYVIVGNMQVILARPDLLQQTDCFICNEIEAAKLFSNRAITSFAPEQMRAFLPDAAKKAGIPAMVVTMGAAGSIWYDGKSNGFTPPYPADVKDTTGAGDAFFSGTVMGLARGMALAEATRCGARLASRTIAGEESCCPYDPSFFESLDS